MDKYTLRRDTRVFVAYLNIHLISNTIFRPSGLGIRYDDNATVIIDQKEILKELEFLARLPKN
jgi:ribosomal protein L14